jgi:hypothetical protein
MKTVYYCILFTLFLLISCTKTVPPSSLTSNKIVGVWVINNQVSGAWPYPWPSDWPAYNYSYAYDASLQFSTFNNDTFNVKFSSDGTYSYTRPVGGYSFPSPGVIVFTPFSLLKSSGPYRVLDDTEIIIEPDTSELLKFCFTSTSTYLGILPGDTLHFNLNSTDSLSVLQRWTEPNEYNVGTPVCVYQTYTLFKKMK